MKDSETAAAEFNERCTACGLCAVMCPVFAHRTVPDSHQEVQRQVRGFLRDKRPTEAVLERSRLCNECYKCVSDTCPQSLDPMRTNQLLRAILHELKVDPRPFIPPSDPGSTQRIAAALLTTDEEYQKITTPAVKGDGRILFFAGCNIYFQPDLLLTAMDILDQITKDWTFLPGLDHCCGGNYDSAGRLDGGSEALEGLALAMGLTAYEKVVVWCPTCSVRLHRGGFDLPVISFARLLAGRQEVFTGDRQCGKKVTIHEPCKNAYLDIDNGAPREVLELVTGEPVREMKRHGRHTVCCGWALRQYQPEVWKTQLKDRFDECAAAGADTIATVCHGCQQIMGGKAANISVVNFIRLAGEALGISHEERSGELRRLKSLGEARDYLYRSLGGRSGSLPYDHHQITGALKVLMWD